MPLGRLWPGVSAPSAEAQGWISPVPAQGAPRVLILEAWALKVSVSETLGPGCSDDGRVFQNREKTPCFLRGSLPETRDSRLLAVTEAEPTRARIPRSCLLDPLDGMVTACGPSWVLVPFSAFLEAAKAR